jgi:putative multiple sugar transport system permease protein
MFLAYTNMSFIAAIAGLVFAARLNSASPVAGQSFEMDAIASCFIGGASAYGGTGTIGGALIGALIMGTLNNGMSIMGISSNTQQVVKGLVLLIAVAIDVLGKKNYNLKGMIDSVKGLFKKTKHA